MPILVGFHVEGNDHIILHALIAKMLGLAKEDITIDFIDASGRGWQFVLELIPRALKRFYSQCAQFAVIGVDNDGNLDLDRTGVPEDPHHPRHDNHPEQVLEECRFCKISQIISNIRPQLNWIQKKPGHHWPILVAVPVEMIETWLLLLRGTQGIQRKPRSVQKQMLYGRPAATRADVEEIALPLVDAINAETIAMLAQESNSFRNFLDQVTAARLIILGEADCW